MVINLKDLDSVIEQIGLRVYAAVQRLELEHKLPIVRGPEYIEFTATVLVSPEALNAIQRTSTEAVTGEALTETVNPEVTSTTTTKRDSKSETKGGTTDKSTEDTSTSNEENGSEDSTTTSSQTSDNNETSENQTEQLHATADKIVISTYS